MKVLIKNFIIGIIVLTLIGCRVSRTEYSYQLKNSKEELSVYSDYISTRILYLNNSKGIPIETIFLTARPISSEYMKNTKIILLNEKVKIVNEGREYWLNINEGKYGVEFPKEGLNIKGEFTIYFGKVKIINEKREDINGKIIEMPPLRYAPYFSKRTYNPTLDALNIKTEEKGISSGFLDEPKNK